jgi:hypothetical protein
MRWTLRISFILLLAWAIFMVSPFVALYSMAKAVRARDLARIEERVNFQALRLSISRQLVTDYLIAVGRGKELEGFNRQVAAEVGASLADPLVAELVTPQAVLDLLDDGWPQGVATGDGAAPAAISFDLDGLKKALTLFVRSESRGFRNIYIPFPPDASVQERFRLHLRLSGTTWRLTGVELPARLRQELVRKLPRGNVRSSSSGKRKDSDEQMSDSPR